MLITMLQRKGWIIFFFLDLQIQLVGGHLYGAGSQDSGQSKRKEAKSSDLIIVAKYVKKLT